MPTQIDPVEFGELRGQVGAIQKTLDQHTAILEKLDAKLDGVVTYQQFAERVEKIDATLDDHEGRIGAVERHLAAADKSFIKKISNGIEANLIKLIAGGALVLLVYVVFYSVQQQLNSQLTPEKVNEIITEKIEETH